MSNSRQIIKIIIGIIISLAIIAVLANFAVNYFLKNTVLNYINYNLSNLKNKKVVIENIVLSVPRKEITFGKIKLSIKSKKNGFVEVLNNGELKIKYLNSSKHFHLKAKGQIPFKDQGQFNSDLYLTSLLPNIKVEGVAEFKNVPLSYFYSIFSTSDKTTITEGSVEITSTIHYSTNYLTTNNIITIENLDIDTKEKKLFGMPSVLVKEFFRENTVTFNLPVNGKLDDLKFDFNAAMTQILIKALKEKFDNNDFLKGIAEKFGRKIGEKLEESMKNRK
ncbi:MAG: hypothetical protein JW871_04845 [Endomicrobiales bacterium]|nr:hypothetical protein [Endomicrobiales bacterium]